MQSSYAAWHIAVSTSARLLAAAALYVALAGAPVAAYEEWHDWVDYTKLRGALGPLVRTGAGTPLSQVEAAVAQSPLTYFVDQSLPEFTGTLDPGSSAVAFTNATDPLNNHISSHTGSVGARFYGNVSSAAPAANNVTIYEANNWLDSVLHVDSTPGDASHPGPPDAQAFRVQNHSWIGTYAPGSNPPAWTEDPRNVDALGRFDYLLDTANGGAGMTAAVGLNNSHNKPPYLIAHSFNAISVGRTDGVHSRGGTNAYDMMGDDDTYFPGRLKPDIVAPRPQSAIAGTTSVATAMVSSAAAMMHEATVGTDAAQSEVIKAMILAGATKGEFANYFDPIGNQVDPWDRTSTQPLDNIFGAGELNIYNTYLTNLGGQHVGVAAVPVTTAGSYGWDYRDFKGQAAVGDISYKFQVPVGSTALEFSIILAWNAEVTDVDATSGFDPSVSLQNLDLELYNSFGGLIDESISALDNVEHIYRTNLAAGQYTLKVTGAADWDYGLAWRMTTQFNAMTADFNANGFVDGGDFLAWQRGFGMLLDATRADGDYNGDGDVDYEDLAGFSADQLPASLAIYGLAASAGAGAGSGAGGAIPEPSSLAAALLGAGLLIWPLRKRARSRRA